MSEYVNCDKDERRGHEGCPATAYQHVSVSVPVSVIPYARVGRIRIHCNGNTSITNGNIPCEGTKDGICTFIVTQSFDVEIPINFGASVNIGDTYVNPLGTQSNANEANNSCDDFLL